MSDLTRWNRAGLSRFEYLDGNAVVFLERLQRDLQQAFPAWQPFRPETIDAPPANETEEARKARLEALYQADPDDLLWQLTRQFARACHVLGGHLDAYANEAYLGTASQWDNLRRLVALLDYVPRPPASASTPLALQLKPNTAGSVAAGLQFSCAPPKGAPITFETLTDLACDAACNTLRAQNHDRNPARLGNDAHTLELEGRLEKLQAGIPLVLEDERSGKFSAHIIDGVRFGDDRSIVTLSPAIPHYLKRGWSLVHVLPTDKLAPLAPATTGVDSVGYALQLAVPSTGLAAGDIVMIRSGDDKPCYRRIKQIAAQRLLFHQAIGKLNLANATVARPVTVPLTRLDHPMEQREIAADGSVLDVVYAAGDWSRLAGQWLADIRRFGSTPHQREYLPLYQCIKANYFAVGTDPALLAADRINRIGYTALTLVWTASEDDAPDGESFMLNNPQALLAPPTTAGAWRADLFLNFSADHHLPHDVITKPGKQTAAGDRAVLVRGRQMAWTQLGAVALNADREQATLTAKDGWQDRGGGPFFLADSRVFSHFTLVARAVDWQRNDTPLSGRRIYPESLPALLKEGRALVIDNGAVAIPTSLARIDAAERRWLELADYLPPGTTLGNLKIYANVVPAGHGESRPERVLGSGDATLDSQQFTLAVKDLSHVADASMSAGVRAAASVLVGSETWTQVASLKDSSASAADYQVRIDEDGHCQFQFGDGRHGRRLPSGGNNIRVRFRQGCGSAGNLPAGVFAKPTRPHALVAGAVQRMPASGGADRESNANLRSEAPATLLALDRAVSLPDYAKLCRSNASVWQAQAFRRAPGLGQSERIEVMVMAAGAGALSSSLQSDLCAFLSARAQPGVVIQVSNYQRLGFRLEISVRVRSASFDARAVQEAVQQALAQAFSEQARQLGQVLYRGEIYDIVDNVTGVENSDCSISLVTPPPAVVPARQAVVEGALLTATPGEGQCLALDGVHIVVQEYQA